VADSSIVSGSSTADAEVADFPRCPRCGGVSRPHVRRTHAGNPFLPKVKSQVTCEDCGLDFDPLTPVDTPRSSSASPWDKP
jgi:hypothetical protein